MEEGNEDTPEAAVEESPPQYPQNIEFLYNMAPDRRVVVSWELYNITVGNSKRTETVS